MLDNAFIITLGICDMANLQGKQKCFTHFSMFLFQHVVVNIATPMIALDQKRYTDMI